MMRDLMRRLARVEQALPTPEPSPDWFAGCTPEERSRLQYLLREMEADGDLSAVATCDLREARDILRAAQARFKQSSAG